MAVTVTGTPTAITSTSQSVTLSAGVYAAIFTWSYYNSSAGSGLASTTLNGNAPDAISEATNGSGGTDSPATGIAIWLNPVTGSSITLAHSFDAATTEGPMRFLTSCSPASGTIGIRGSPNSASEDGASTPTFNLTGLTAGDLVVAMDQKFNSVPANPASWTSHATQGPTNNEGARLRSIAATGTSQTVSANGPDYSSITAVALYEIAGAGGVSIPIAYAHLKKLMQAH